MSGFRSFKKAKGEQAALKMGLYGPPGSGKTMTSLLLAEGLGKFTSKRVAFVDTEHGSDFYCQSVPSRAVHPEEFDFDSIYTRALTEVLPALKQLQAEEYGVIVIDSITHLWEAAIAAYSGKQTSIGSIPMHAWGRIKRPYLDLLSFLLSSPMHVIICGRQKTEYATDAETEELKAIGVAMRAEGSTAYEPHCLLRMEAVKPRRTNEIAQIVAYAEKDRTGILAGRSFVNPTFDTLCKPLLGLLGGTQAKVQTTDEAATTDAETLAADEIKRSIESSDLLKDFAARLTLAKDVKALKTIGAEITPAIKAKMLPSDVAELREKYQDQESRVTPR